MYPFDPLTIEQLQLFRNAFWICLSVLKILNYFYKNNLNNLKIIINNKKIINNLKID